MFDVPTYFLKLSICNSYKLVRVAFILVIFETMYIFFILLLHKTIHVFCIVLIFVVVVLLPKSTKYIFGLT